MVQTREPDEARTRWFAGGRRGQKQPPAPEGVGEGVRRELPTGDLAYYSGRFRNGQREPTGTYLILGSREMPLARGSPRTGFVDAEAIHSASVSVRTRVRGEQLLRVAVEPLRVTTGHAEPGRDEAQAIAVVENDLKLGAKGARVVGAEHSVAVLSGTSRSSLPSPTRGKPGEVHLPDRPSALRHPALRRRERPPRGVEPLHGEPRVECGDGHQPGVRRPTGRTGSDPPRLGRTGGFTRVLAAKDSNRRRRRRLDGRQRWPGQAWSW